MKRGFFRLWLVLSILWVGYCLSVQPWKRDTSAINRAYLQGLARSGSPFRASQARQAAIDKYVKQDPIIFTYGYPIIGGFIGMVVLWVVGGFKPKKKKKADDVD